MTNNKESFDDLETGIGCVLLTWAGCGVFILILAMIAAIKVLLSFILS